MGRTLLSDMVAVSSYPLYRSWKYKVKKLDDFRWRTLMPLCSETRRQGCPHSIVLNCAQNNMITVCCYEILLFNCYILLYHLNVLFSIIDFRDTIRPASNAFQLHDTLLTCSIQHGVLTSNAMSMMFLQGAVTLLDIAGSVCPVPGLTIAARIAQEILNMIDVRNCLLNRSCHELKSMETVAKGHKLRKLEDTFFEHQSCRVHIIRRMLEIR